MVKLTMLCLPVILFLTACDNEGFNQQDDNKQHISQIEIEQKRHAEENEKFKINPNPQKQYQLIINIENVQDH